MTHSEAGKGDAPRKQQDQKAYEEGWERIFAKKPKRNVQQVVSLKDAYEGLSKI